MRLVPLSFKRKILNIFLWISPFLLSFSNCNAQLLRPSYQAPCERLTTVYKSVSITYDVSEGVKKDFVAKIINPKNYPLQEPYFSTPSQALEISSFDNSKLALKPKMSIVNEKERNKIVIMANLNSHCSDTLEVLTVNFTPLLFKKIRFLGRVEFGYLNNNVTNSIKNSQTNERYQEGSSSGLVLGCELVEFRAPENLLYFGMSFGLNDYISSMTSITTASNKVSTNDLLINFRGDLPFYFVNKKLKDLSLRFYLSFPFLQTGSISSNVNGLNDKNDVNLYYGLGLNYSLTKWCAIEFKNVLENGVSSRSGTNMIYSNMIKSELIFSFTNVYDNLHELLSE